MEEFFADGGTTSFVDRLTGSLGIHASSVKIVSVYEGSLIVNYEIEADEDDTDGSALAAIAARQDEMMASGSIDLGAPVLAYEAKTQIETSTDTNTPVTIVAPTYAQDNKNTANVFKPDAQIVTETSVAYKENTVTIELENEAVIKTETIMVDSPTPDAKIVTIRGEKPEKDGRGVIIVAVALGFIALVMIGLCFKQFVLKPKQQVIELEEQIKRAKNVVEPKRDEQTQVKAKTYNVLSRDSIQPEEGVIQYEP